MKTVAVIGNPNTGKSTLFNALTGMKARVANYPGVTVEHKIGTLTVADQAIQLIDLPGTYSLAAQSPDEMIAIDVLLGQRRELAAIHGILAIVDASNLQRNLYLVSQLLELRRPMILVLNMMDIARTRGMTIDTAQLSRALGIPVLAVQANTGAGLEAVRSALHQLETTATPLPTPSLRLGERIQDAAITIAHDLGVTAAEAQRILIDTTGFAAQRALQQHSEYSERLRDLRAAATNGEALAAVETAARYRWIRGLLQDVVTRPAIALRSTTERIDRILTHKVYGSLIFVGITLLIFQAIYAWTGPLMDLLNQGFAALGSFIGGWLPTGALRSLIVDGAIAGVGSVLVFLPQIALLFLFIAILEDSGYMARAAFLMDKLLASVGLSGKSFIPLLSSFACAVPGIMATRTIENRRDRLATILVAPLMSCSARLPVYTLLIAAFIPATPLLGGWLGLQGLTLFAMHTIGFLVAIPMIWCFKRSLLKGRTPPFVMELPSYKLPSLRLLADRVYDRCRAFVRRAGTIIFAMSIVIWALSYFPRPAEITASFAAQRYAMANSADTTASQLAAIDAAEAGALLQASALGQLGTWIEPAVRPLGWDWRLGMAALASFPAREVIIAVLGTIYSLGANVDEASSPLQHALRAARWPDGRAVFNIPVALSIMIFFALCCQCGATVATIRRETNSWGYAWFTFGYMTALAYVAALVVYQVGIRIAM